MDQNWVPLQPLAGCSWSAVVSVWSRASREPPTTGSRPIHACVERRLALRVPAGPRTHGRGWPGLVWLGWVPFCLIWWWQAHTRMHHGKKTSWWRQCDAWGDVLLRCFSPTISVGVGMGCGPSMSTGADLVHPTIVA